MHGSRGPSHFDRHRGTWLPAILFASLLVPPAWPQEVASRRSELTGSFASIRRLRDVKDRAADSFSFRITASQVLVPVTVTDGDGRLVTGLGPQDFRVFEDGFEQGIDMVLDEATPLTLAIVVDVSGSMKSKMQDVASSLEELLDALGERDRAFLLAFHGSVVTLQEPTYDLSLLAEALSGFEPTGGTAMFDGIVEGLYRPYKMGPRTRRALILLSDGFDNASLNTPRETIAAAKATGIPIYGIGLGKKRRGLFGRLFGDPTNLEFEGLHEIRLRELSERTGGCSYIVADIKRQKTNTTTSPLARAFGRLARELRFHYVLTYRPPSNELDGRWHGIRVELSRPDLFARFRPGYLALPLE
ncbi:MAG TPA: VWA domain-containing protein [Vicinamibacteria bacterium]